MKVCDPLYGYIHFDDTIESIIHLPVFQRLRSIQQLGFAQYAFPSGIGNRFTHSLGSSHLAGKAFDSVFNKNFGKSLPLSSGKKKELKKTLQVAALLHDIGHGPLSHSSECLMPNIKNHSYLNAPSKRKVFCHEDYSVRIIRETEVSDCLKKSGLEPQAVAQLIHKEFSGAESFFEDKGISYLPLLRQIISSELDVDRMDYLHRDSMHCGVKYGVIDFLWLLSHFDSHKQENQIFLSVDSKALYTVESFMLGRQQMRMTVYFHHKPVIYNEMLKKYAQISRWKLPVDVQEYSQFTDSQLMNQLREESETNEWASRIIKQQPYVRLYEYNRISDSERKIREDFYRIKENLEKENISYIDINSNKDAIKPSKKMDSYPIFLKNNFLKTRVNLFKDSNTFKLAQRQIDRIYVDPKHLEPAKKLLF